MKFDEIGYWSEVKLDIVREYGAAYSKILSKQRGLQHVYIDAFAGAGQHISKRTGEFITGRGLVYPLGRWRPLAQRKEVPNMGARKFNIEDYETRRGTRWKWNERFYIEGMPPKRVAHQGFRTAEAALSDLLATQKSLQDTGKLLRRLPQTITVKEIWKRYRPVSEMHVRSWKTDKGRAKHLGEHLGTLRAKDLNTDKVNQYRQRRRGERTKRGGPPSNATLNREIELLKRMLNYAVECG